ncbi:hypothetical protein D0T87_13025 [Bacteroides sp. 51]|nr:hypothetical protein [Bacteroides sp. 51]
MYMNRCIAFKRIKLLFLSFFVCSCALAGDTIKTKRPQFISAQFSEGFLLPNSKIGGDGGSKTPAYSALTLKYGLSARGDRWQDALYGMPYKGIGVYLPYFPSDKYDLGDPFSVFLFQGARLKQFSPHWSLHYEINLGVAFGWQHYDVYERPRFMALGSSTNIHLAGNWYLKWKLSRHWDLHVGVSITHFSNGALRTPNNGINKASAFIEMAYKIHPVEEKKILTEGVYTPPAFHKNTAHDLAFMFTTRTVKVDTIGTGLRSKYPKHRFKVAGLSYSYMFHNTRRFMFGPSLEAVYDESVRAEFRGEHDPISGQYSEYIKLGKFSDRFSVGVSLKGELTMPGYSIFANLGYDVLHKDKIDKRLYQIYGLKVYLFNDLYATFGVRSTNLTRSRYLYLNVGYTFRHFRKK